MLDEIRYGVALLTLLTFPWALVVWYLVHPFVDFWRRVGPKLTYSALIGLGVAMGRALWQFREPLLAVEYGTHPVLWVLAIAAYAMAILIEVQCRKHLSFTMLVGFPELAPPPEGGKLLEEGIYARLRHPRYVSVTFGMLAAAFFCNYLAMWVMTALTVPALLGVVHFEERELRRRFGDAYADYSRRVPRFFPRAV